MQVIENIFKSSFCNFFLLTQPEVVIVNTVLLIIVTVRLNIANKCSNIL